MKGKVLQTNFTAGELSPKLYGRVDIARYQNGAKKVRDCLPQIYGGVRRRPGSLHVNEVKTSAKKTRLVPFVFNEDTAYMLELGDLYMRIFKDGALLSPGAPAAYSGATAYVPGSLVSNGGVNYYCIKNTTGNAPPNLTYWYAMPAGIYEIPTPYTEVMLADVDYTQGADTMFLFQESLDIRRLVRAAETTWVLDAPIEAGPFEEPGTYPIAELTPTVASPVGASTILNASASVFNPAMGGCVVKINGGIVKLTGFISGTSFSGTIKQELASLVAAPADAWSLHAPAWSVSRGYPRTGTLFEQRLVVGGSPAFPQTLWGSITAAYLDFTQGTADDNGFSFTVASDQINPIQYLASSRTLVAFTSGGEFTITGGLEKPLAPTNAQIRQRSNYGCARVRPVRIRDSEIFIQRAGRKVRSFAYNVANDDWTAPDIAVLSEHVTETGIAGMCWQQEPDSIVWMFRTDGVPISVTYDKDQDVTAWAIHDGFTGQVESMATIPDANGDQVWMVVKRTVNGSVVRYIERFLEGTLSDCAVVDSDASPQTVWNGLSHLNGEEVVVVGDGGVVGRYTVAGGQITIARPSLEVVIGLDYENRVELLAPEMATQDGSSSGSAMSCSEVITRWHETTGATVNGDKLIFREMPDAVDAPPTSYSGTKSLAQIGWDKGDAELVIAQSEPMPWHLLSVARTLTVNS
jgi:hypothetical protein